MAKDARQALFVKLDEAVLRSLKAVRRYYKCKNNAEALEKMFALASKQFLQEHGVKQVFNQSFPGIETERGLIGAMWRMVDILTNEDSSYKLSFVPAGSIWEERGFQGPQILAKDEVLTETGLVLDKTVEIKLVPDWLEGDDDNADR